MILPPPDLRRPVVGLGLVTLAAYGGWFYGFGVLVQPIADDTGWTVGMLGAAYAAAQQDLRARLEEEAREKVQELKAESRRARQNDNDDDDDDHDVEIVYEP